MAWAPTLPPTTSVHIDPIDFVHPDYSYHLPVWVMPGFALACLFMILVIRELCKIRARSRRLAAEVAARLGAEAAAPPPQLPPPPPLVDEAAAPPPQLPPPPPLVDEAVAPPSQLPPPPPLAAEAAAPPPQLPPPPPSEAAAPPPQLPLPEDEYRRDTPFLHLPFLFLAPAMDDASNPLFLHHSNGPGLVLVSSYNTWSCAMLIALSVKNKLGFLDGSLKKPASDDKTFAAWTNVIISWIFNSVSKDIVASVMYSDSAFEIWQDLKDGFQQKNGPRIFQLRNYWLLQCVHLSFNNNNMQSLFQ